MKTINKIRYAAYKAKPAGKKELQHLIKKTDSISKKNSARNRTRRKRENSSQRRKHLKIELMPIPSKTETVLNKMTLSSIQVLH